MKKKRISIIVTCYNEEENIEEMYRRIVAVFKKIPRYDFELIYVDNASTDRSEKIYLRLTKKDRRVKLIVMSRNFGSPQPSFLAGLEYSTGDMAFLLHGDIQDPPELLSKFVERWKQGYSVVYGVRTSRKGYGIIWNMLYKGFYYVLNKLAYISIPLDAGDFSLLDRRVVDELLAIDEYDYYLRCLRAYVGFKQIGVPYVRDARSHGQTNESVLSGFWWAKTILVNFSFKPLEWISTIAFFVMIFTFLLMVFDLVTIILFHNSPRGIPTVVILILFLGGVQLLSLSVIAEYLAKIFLEVKRRPRYIVRTTVNIKKIR
ncbi:MAG TPA: glycosyltransferase family 2 protein [Patescibacteria group bacterium]|nr:glycosyltransferase family 2 protein [Patescibacteria group bacterium]